MSLKVPIRRIERLDKSELEQSRLVQSQEVNLNRKFVEQEDSFEIDSGFLKSDSEESSSVFNSENDRPVSKSSSQSSEPDEFERKNSNQDQNHNRILSAMEDEGPACWQMQNQVAGRAL